MANAGKTTASGNEQAVTLAVPASTSNLGPGFDTLGMALDLCNEVTLRVGRIGDASGVDHISGAGADSLATDGSNLVLRAATALYRKLGQTPPPLRATLHNRIPLARGLGSSGAAAIGGLVGANILTGERLDEAGLLALATDLEGHPDNVAPALLGGLVISAVAEARDGQRILTHRLAPPPAAIALCIPEQPLATEAARRCCRGTFRLTPRCITSVGWRCWSPRWLPATTPTCARQWTTACTSRRGPLYFRRSCRSWPPRWRPGLAVLASAAPARRCLLSSRRAPTLPT